jgi:hypothetical protein
MKRFLCCFKNIKLPSNSLNNVNDKLEGPISYEETIQFVPPIKKGVVIKVYDGDTITIASKLPYKESPIYRFSVRLAGIDCPEIKGKNENERTIAELAKKELSNLIMNKELKLFGSFRFANVFEEAMKMVAAGIINLDGIVTHTFSFNEIPKAMECALEKDNVMKVQIEL